MLAHVLFTAIAWQSGSCTKLVQGNAPCFAALAGYEYRLSFGSARFSHCRTRTYVTAVSDEFWAGFLKRSEETHCRFCDNTLGNWKTELFPKKDADSNARPVMRFCLNGKVYYIVPKPGGDGLSDFKDTVRKLCNLSDDTQLDLSFQCSDPVGGKFSL